MANNIFTFQKNVTTSGTPVQLQAQSIDSDQIVLIKAKSANSGTITVGYSSATALNSGTGHFKLAAGQSIELEVPDTSKVWIDSTSSGDGVEVFVGASGGSSGGSGGGGGGSVTGPAADNAAASGNPVRTGAKYNSSAPTYDNGDVADNQADVNGNLKVTLATLISGEDLTNDLLKTELRYSVAYISSATTTQVKTGSGLLHAIVVGTTAAGTIQIIDNTSGSTVNMGELKSSIAEGTYVFNATFATGLRIITGAASKISVIYR